VRLYVSRELLLSPRWARSPSLRDCSRSSNPRKPSMRSTLEVSNSLPDR
jgi:hypothetical protein